MEKIIDKEMVSVQSYLNKFCTMYADRVFLKIRTGNEVVQHTYAELKDDSFALAKAFIDKGYTNKHLAIMSENRYEFVVTFFASLLSGTVFVPVDVSTEPQKIMGMLNFADVDIVCSTKATEPLRQLATQSCPKISEYIYFDGESSDTSYSALLEKGKKLEDAEFYGSLSDDRTAMLCFTSGTSSGKPKCVMLRCSGLFSSPRHMVYRYYRNYKEKKVYEIYSPLPFFHLAGIIAMVVIATIPVGNSMSTSTSFAESFRDIMFFKPSYIMTVPAMTEELYNMIMQNIRRVDGNLDAYKEYCAACDRGDFPTREERRIYCSKYIDDIFGPLLDITATGAKTAEALQNKYSYLGLRVICGYGMTETSPQVSEDAPIMPEKKGSVGWICSFNEAKIVDGVLYIKGENVMKGYYKNPEATNAVLSEDGWYCTGDIAEIDDDGYLFVKGRATNIVVLSNGENIDTDELTTLFVSSDAIEEIVITADSKKNNNTLGALIYPSPNASESEVSEAVREINKGLPIQKRIIRFRLVDKPFEKNEMQKIKRYLYIKEEI